MTHLSIIGTGTMGQAIAAVAGRGGHTVQLIGNGDSATRVDGDVVVLAVPYSSVRSSSPSAVTASRARSSSTSPTR